MQDAILGLDIGTTSTKAVLFDLDGAELAAAERPYPFQTPQTGWVEQDPEALWTALVEAVRATLAGAGQKVRPAAMALAAQSGSLIPADRAGRPVYPIITWLDGRTEELVEQWKAAGIETQVRQVSGWLLHPGLCLPAIAWLRQHKPEVFSAAERFLSVNDFLTYRLTGRFCTNPSNGGGMQLADVATATWSRALCELAGIRPDRLSPIRPSGAVIGPIRAEVSRSTELPPETVVINGGHDQGCTALAMGVASPGKVLLAGGTSWVVTTVVTEPAVESIPAGMDMNFHPAPGRWTVSQSLGGLGASLEWWLNQSWQGPDCQSPAGRGEMYGALDQELKQSSGGQDGLFFLPLAGGHREPAGVQRGGFVGVRLGHTRGDMARAILEGAAYELRWALARMEESGLAVERLWMVGGAARSSVWPKIVAEVTGAPIYLPQYGQWPALGAAIVAGWGAGLYESLEAGQASFQKATKLIEPDRPTGYHDSFRMYQRLVELQATIDWQHRLGER